MRGEGCVYSYFGNVEFDLGNFKKGFFYYEFYFNIVKELGDCK